MNFIKRNFKKVILGLSLCLSLFVGIFALNNAKADNLAPNYFVENPSYNDVWYSNTINITNIYNYDAPNMVYNLSNNVLTFEFRTDTTTEFDMQGVGFDFITKYYYPYGINAYDNFMLSNPIIVSITFDVKMYEDVNGGEWSDFSFDNHSNMDIEQTLFDSWDFYDCFGLIDSYDSSFYEIANEENNYYYAFGSDLTKCNVYFSIPFGSFEHDMQELSTLFFGFKSDYYKENNMLIQLEIYNIEICNPFVMTDLMHNYKNDFDISSQQYNDYVENHTYTNNQYNTLNDNYNDLQDDYNELESNYNKLNNSYNALINSSAPFNNDNIKSIQVSTSNNGVISGYDDLLLIYDRELQVDSSILRDIISEYNLQQSSNVGVAIDLKLNNLAYIPFVEVKANSSGFEYEFILKNNDTTVYYTTVDSNDGPYDNGLLQQYGDFEFNRVIITIYNIDISHYGDPNSYLLTSISFFDGYSQAMKDNQVTIDSYKNQINILNSEISDLSRSVSELQLAYNNLSESYENMLNGNNFATLFFTIAQTPFESFKTIWNVDFLGVNLSGFVTGILFIGLIIWLIKKVF